MVEIFLFILVAGLLANFIGASVHEGIFVGALVCPSPFCLQHPHLQCLQASTPAVLHGV